MLKTLAIIPARGGSKGVPHKNRRIVGGLPLIAHTLRAARAACSLNAVVVSTDEEEIAVIAMAEGVDVIHRPAAIAADDSPVIDAVRHVLEARARAGAMSPDAIVLLQPTSPFREPGDIDAAVALFLETGSTSVCSVYRCDDAHPARMYRIEEGRLVSFMPELASVRRQELPPVYHRNGSIYVFGQREVVSGNIIGEAMVPYVMPQESSVNVDSEIDLLLVQAMMEQRLDRSDPGA